MSAAQEERRCLACGKSFVVRHRPRYSTHGRYCSLACSALARRRDLGGQRFGRWTVLRRVGSRKFLCRCDCGTEREVFASALSRGASKSCGCIMRARAQGLRKMPEHTTWTNMLTRCRNPKNPQYSAYGGRGIRVCERWHKFVAFLEDMGPRPSVDHSIDRIDVNGHYEPANCRWATPKQQMRNRRLTVYLTVRDVTRPLVEWADEAGISRSTIRQRIARGWPAEAAVSRTPELVAVRMVVS